MTPTSPPSPEAENTASIPLELLAPAGDFTALEAALEAGADAVYFGLTTLNARRRAKNFSPEEFGRAVAAVHARGAKAYLTLNIDLTDRELGRAARALELARQHGVDAVLVRDPALLALRPHYPELQFHFSTQTCMANSADVAAAGELGASRVVLARELTLAETTAASRVPGVETEVFCQGALCFCVSGRCLLSSWVGGRSGNRGACTSPCRVPWTVDGRPAHTPLSTHDLGAVHRLAALRKAGVAAVKIEGRLKTADWVRSAVDIYRRALQGEDPNALLEEARRLGAYTGRALTCGYLDGQRDELTGIAARGVVPPASAQEDATSWDRVETPPAARAASPEASQAPLDLGATDAADLAAGEEAEAPLPEDEETTSLGPTYNLSLNPGAKGIEITCTCGECSTQWTIPKTVVRRAHKAVTLGRLLEWLTEQVIHGVRLDRGETSDADFMIVPRAANALVDKIGAVLRKAQKEPDDLIRTALPEPVRELLEKGEPHALNRRTLGQKPDRVRIDARSVREFISSIDPHELVVERVSARTIDAVLDACPKGRVVIALPSVFFEDELPHARALVRACAEAKVPVEVNSWGGWKLAKDAGLKMEAGPGLPVLNALAAQTLADAGMRCVTLSPEADRKQLETVTAHCPAPCSLIVFGRPALLTTRAQLNPAFAGREFADRRGARIVPQVERGLWVFRPTDPYELRNVTNERIRVAHLVVDLVGSPDPVGDWYAVPTSEEDVFHFNYDRSLA